MRSRLGRFPGNVSEPFCLRATIFVMDMVYGMLASGSVMLTDIGRQLGEPICLEHTEKRLSRNLAREELAPVISTALCREAVAHVQRDTLLILDPTDISKPYARKMQYLATIRDGSAKRLTEGYWMVSVVGAEAGQRRMIPIWGEVFSQESPEFISENEQLLRAVRTISKATEGRGIWVIDRGRLFQELSAEEGQRHRFIVRLRGDRHPLRQGFAPMAAMDLARNVATGHGKHLVREGGGRSTSLDLCFGASRVRLPQHPEIPLWLVVVRGTGKTPLLLLTNVPTSPSSGSLWRIVSSYLIGWSMEEAFRFIEQAYDIENIRVVTFDRIRNLVWLLMLAVYFVAVLLSGPYRLQLAVLRLVERGKPLFGMPEMPLYALARGLATLFSRHPRAPRPRRAPPATQLPLFDT